MAEKKIELKEIDPIDIFGVNDRIINRLGKYFPQLKITPRGNCIMLKGSYKDITNFEHSVNVLIDTRKHKRNLNLDDVDQIFESPQSPLGMPDDFPMGISGEDDGEIDNIDPRSRRGDLGDEGDIIVFGNEGKIIRARTKNQKKLVSDYYTHDLVFAIGPAGTGKTYTAIALAVRALKNREVKKLILTRPAVEAGERLGFLPGDLKDKLDPYLQPLYDALGDMIPNRKLQELMEDGTIQIAPLAYMRGRTLDKACVILDEAQNTNIGQLKMFLTRMGTGAKFIVTGDASQVDLPNREDSGLLKGVNLLKNIKGIETIVFTNEDIVRHPLVGKIVKAFDKQ